MNRHRNSRIAGSAGVAAACVISLIWGTVSGCGSNDEPLPPVDVSGSLGPPVTIRPERMPSKSALTMNLDETPQERTTARRRGAGPAGGTVAIDTSTPEATVRTFAEMMNSGRLGGLPQVFSPAHQEVANLASQHLGPLLAALDRARAAWRDQFPDTPPFSGDVEVPFIYRQSSVGDVEMGPGQDSAQVTLITSDGQEIGSVRLTRVDDSWRIDDPRVLPLSDDQSALANLTPRMASAIDQFTRELEAGGFANPNAAMNALASRMTAIEPATPLPADAEPAIDLELDLGPPGGDTATPPRGGRAQPGTTARERDPNDPVDSTFSGPGMLRRR